MEAARVLHGSVGVEEGVVAAVVEAETEILEREPQRRLTDEAPRGVRGDREVAGARAVQLRDGTGLIALVDRSDDVRASLDAADFQPGVKLRAQPQRLAPRSRRTSAQIASVTSKTSWTNARRVNTSCSSAIAQ